MQQILIWLRSLWGIIGGGRSLGVALSAAPVILRRMVRRRQAAKGDQLLALFGSRESLHAWRQIAHQERENLLYWQEILRLKGSAESDYLIRLLLSLSSEGGTEHPGPTYLPPSATRSLDEW